jgi:hypothetical protein
MEAVSIVKKAVTIFRHGFFIWTEQHSGFFRFIAVLLLCSFIRKRLPIPFRQSRSDVFSI